MPDDFYDNLMAVYNKNNPNFECQIVNGGHHLHLNTPELLAPIINDFLLKHLLS